MNGLFHRLTSPPTPVPSSGIRWTRILICALIALLSAPGAVSAAPGDPFVVYTANSYADGAVILRTDPAAGSVVEISRNGAQGTLFERPFDLALQADGQILVADLGTPCTAPRCAGDGRIIRVDPLTGRQSLVSAGGRLVDPAGIAVAPDGPIFVADNQAADNDGAVLRIDPATGAQTEIARGAPLDLPFGILVDRDGSLVVSNRMTPGGCAGPTGRLVRVQLNGTKETIASGGLFSYPLGVTLDASGRIVFANECGANALVRVTGALLEPLTPNGASDVLVTPERLALDPAGDLLVSDFSLGDGDGGIARVNAQSGAQSLLRQDQLFNHPLGIAAVVNRAPAAALRLDPPAVAAGRPVLLDASASADPDGLGLVHEWDLDGDGAFEAGTGAGTTVSRTWGVDGPAAVRLRVTDPHGGQAVAEGVVNVDGRVPVLTRLRTGSRVLGVGPRRRSRAAAARVRRPRPPRATSLRFSASEPATVRVAIERVRSGRRARRGAPCRLKAKRGRRCLRRAQVRAVTRAARPGANRLPIRARGLRPGSYRLEVTAVDAVGNSATARRLSLRVVRLRG